MVFAGLSYMYLFTHIYSGFHIYNLELNMRKNFPYFDRKKK